MNAVAAIIRRNLLGGRRITIPTLGTLIVQRVAAQIVDAGTRLTAPHKSIAIAQLDAISVIHYIAASMSIDEDRATKLYNEWLDEAATDGVHLCIESVGVVNIETNEIQLEDEFKQLLNPRVSEKIVIRRATVKAAEPLPTIKRQGNTMVIISVIVTLAAVGYLGYYFLDELQELFY